MKIDVNELLSDAIEFKSRDFANDLQAYRKRAAALKLLLQHGVVFQDTPSLTWAFSGWKVDVTQLPACRAALGRLKVSDKQPCYELPADEQQSAIKVLLSPVNEEFAVIRISYIARLKDGSKCRVEEHASSYKSVVCSI
jgi:hypothetical protein